MSLPDPLFHRLFPLAVYENKVQCHDQIKKILLENYEKEKFQVAHEESETLPDGTVRTRTTTKFTGEAHGLALFHKKPEYKEFFKELKKHALLYLQSLGLDTTRVDVYVMKSWLVIHNDFKESMPAHIHPESNISFVYYVRKNSSSQNIVFENSSNQNDISQDIFYADFSSDNSVVVLRNEFNESERELSVAEGSLVMFPGWRTKHGTRNPKNADPKDFCEPRLAIAGDLKVVLRPDRLATMTLSSSLEHWEKL